MEVNGGSRGDVGSQGGDAVGGGRPVESEGIRSRELENPNGARRGRQLFI